jgi:hypothetical protein
MSDAKRPVLPPPIPRQDPPERREPTTKEIPRVLVPGSTLDAVLYEVRAVRQDTDLLVGNWRSISEWRGELEQWRADVDEAITRNSRRVKEPSAHDIAAATELAKERLAREALAQKVDGLAKNDEMQNGEIAELKEMLTDVKNAVIGVIRNPKVRLIGQALFLLAGAYIAAHGLKIVP